MGNIPTALNLYASFANIKVIPDSDSISSPGKKSVVSEPIGKDVYVNFDAFFSDVAINAKASILPWDLFAVKDHVYFEHSPNDFECWQILDGKRLQMVRRQEDDKDVKANWCRVHVDYEKKAIASEVVDPDTGSTKHWSYAHFHFDEKTESFVLESWVEEADGTRRSGPAWAVFVEWIFLRPHLFLRHYGRVKVRALQDSPDGADFKVVLSDDVSEHYKDPDALLDALVTMMKQETVQAKGSVDYGDSDQMVTLTLPFSLSNPLAPEETQSQTLVPDVVLTRYLHIHRDKHLLAINCFLKGQDEVVHPFLDVFYKVYSDPIRCGYYIKRPGTDREVGSFYEAVQLHHHMNLLVRERDVIQQVDSLDEKNFYF